MNCHIGTELYNFIQAIMAASIETVVPVALESDKNNADTDKDAATATPPKKKKEKALTKI